MFRRLGVPTRNVRSRRSSRSGRPRRTAGNAQPPSPQASTLFSQQSLYSWQTSSQKHEPFDDWLPQSVDAHDSGQALSGRGAHTRRMRPTDVPIRHPIASADRHADVAAGIRRLDTMTFATAPAHRCLAHAAAGPGVARRISVDTVLRGQTRHRSRVEVGVRAAVADTAGIGGRRDTRRVEEADNTIAAGWEAETAIRRGAGRRPGEVRFTVPGTGRAITKRRRVGVRAVALTSGGRRERRQVAKRVFEFIVMLERLERRLQTRTQSVHETVRERGTQFPAR